MITHDKKPKRLPYHFCWWCSRQLRSKTRHRVRTLPGHDVMVHAACNDDMEREQIGEAREDPSEITRAAEDAALASLTQ
jgi:hypothetical protein